MAQLMAERFHKAKLAFGCYASKIQRSCSTFSRFGPPSKPAYSNSSQICPASSSPIFQRFDPKRIHPNQFPASGCGRRFYYPDHFKPREPRKWFQVYRPVLVAVSVGSCVFIDVDLGQCENVPFTTRKHFVAFSKFRKRQVAEYFFNQLKEVFEKKILPEMHPESVRVRAIAKKIIEAVERGLKQDGVGKDMSYGEIKGIAEETRTKIKRRNFPFGWI